MSDSFTVVNSKGDTVATIAPKAVDVSSPITMLGNGYSGYNKIFQENWYHLMEHFHHTTAPTNPKVGMIWSHEGVGLKFYNGTGWVPLATGATSEIQLARLSSASNINFGTTGSHQLHTGATGVKTLITSMLLVTKATTSVSGIPASVQLETSTNAADIADKIVLMGLSNTNKFAKYPISGAQGVLNAGSTVSLNIKQAAAGGDTLICDVYLYGLVI